MSRSRWTIIIVPQGAATSRVIDVSQTALKLLGTLTVAAGLIAILLGYGTISKSVDLHRAQAAEAENLRLANDLGVVQGRMARLTDSITSLERRDGQIRLLANLEPIDPQVHAAGIGGPRPADPAAEGSTELLERAALVKVDLAALTRRANLLSRSFKEAADSLAAHTERLEATPSIMPTQGWLASAFARMRVHPILHRTRAHEGIDVVAPAGTPIEAPAAGKVVFAGWDAGYGNMVTVDHGFGITTRFAHASRLLVKVGQTVKRGDRIGLVGNTGLSTGPHLHYEVHVNGRPVDPRKYILPDVVTD